MTTRKRTTSARETFDKKSAEIGYINTERT